MIRSTSSGDSCRHAHLAPCVMKMCTYVTHGDIMRDTCAHKNETCRQAMNERHLTLCAHDTCHYDAHTHLFRGCRIIMCTHISSAAVALLCAHTFLLQRSHYDVHTHLCTHISAHTCLEPSTGVAERHTRKISCTSCRRACRALSLACV